VNDVAAHRSNLDRRRMPMQARGKKRVDEILDATAAIVKEEGLARLTTNLVAERAGVPIGTIYQFFPNKAAILVALEQRFVDRVTAALDALLQSVGTGLSLMDRLIDDMARLWREDEALMLNWHALRTEPQFAALEAESVKIVAHRNAALLERMGVVPPARRDFVGAILQEWISAHLDFAAKLSPAKRREAVKELKRMVRAYLQSYSRERTR